MSNRNKLPGIILINPSINHRNYISLGYIAAYVNAKGFKAKVLDFNLEKPSPAMIKDICKKQNPVIIGIAAYQISMLQVISIAKFFKKFSKAKIIIGGPQVPGMPDKALFELRDIDYLCCGEGELVCFHLLRALNGQTPIENVPGISYRLSKTKIKTTVNPEIPKDLDDYPSPYLNGFIKLRVGSIAQLLSSRGCTHECSFCITPFLNNRKIRFHSIQRVISEIEFLVKKGINQFWFADPAFSANKSKTIKLFQSIIKSGLNIEIWCETRTDMINDKVIRLMKKAGVKKISFGLESTSPSILNNLKKRQKIDEFTSIVKKIQANGIKVELLHMVGIPGETFASIINTFDYIRSLGIYFTGNTIGNHFNIYFGAEICRNPRKHGVIIPTELRSKSYPSYLSPGENFKTKSLYESDFIKIQQRWQAELFTGSSIDNYNFYRRRWNLSARDIFNLPLELIEHLISIFASNPTTKKSNNGAIHNMTFFNNKKNYKLWKESLFSNLENLSYDFSIELLGINQCILFDENIAETICGKLRSSLLYNATIIFDLTPDIWMKNKVELHKVFERFLRPIHTNNNANMSSSQNLCELICLINITNAEIDTKLAHLYSELVKENITPLFFFYFTNKNSVSNFLEKVRLFNEKMPEMKFKLFGGISDLYNYYGLKNLYNKISNNVKLPFLYLFNDKVLYQGGCYKAEISNSTLNLCIDSDGNKYSSIFKLLGQA